MNTKILIAALAVAVGTMGVSPAEVDAKPKKIKKAIKKSHKQSYKVQKNHYKRHHNYGHYGGYRAKYNRPDYKRESYGIYTTPGGGLGFYYSESKRPGYGYPYGYGGYRYY